MQTFRERVTDALDVLGLLAIATGVAGGFWPRMAWFALLPAGAVVLAGSAFAASREPAAASDDGPPAVRTPRRTAGGPATESRAVAKARRAIEALARGRRRRGRRNAGTPGVSVA